MNRERHKKILVLLLCLLVGFALRFYTLDRKSLWIDEVHTFNESRYDQKDQFIHYKENPAYLQPPLFYLLTHLFYPFTKPERDLRIVPLIFGTLSIPMIYLLAAQFSSSIALPCALSLTFMVYHISLSQDGRSYSLLLFLGMSGLYFLMKHLNTSKRGYLIPAAFSFVLSFYTSFTSLPFVALVQIFWFYQTDKDTKARFPASFLFLNGLILLLCLPSILSAFSYKSQPAIDTLRGDGTIGSFLEMIYNIIQDWAPHMPLTVLSLILLILLPFFLRPKKNALILLGVLILPLVGTYIFWKLFNIAHFVSSRYFINLLPLFFVTLFLSLDAIERRGERLRKYRLNFLFFVLLVSSNLIILPLYYQSEKQDLKGLVTHLKGQIQDGDKIIVGNRTFIPGILHYFGIHPIGRHHSFPAWKVSEKEIEYRVGLTYQNLKLTIITSHSYWFRYFADGSRLWIVADKKHAKYLRESGCVFRGYFDGSFFSMDRFPTDVSMYLLLWDPKSPDEKGIEMPIE